MVIQKKLLFFALSMMCLGMFNEISAETWAEYALNKASEWGCTRVVSSLLHFGVDPTAVNSKTTALMRASENGHADVVDLLLQAGDEKYRSDVLHKTDAELALCKASERGHAQAVSSLLRFGVDPTAVTSTEALLAAAHNGYADVINLLPETGADCGLAQTAFIFAVSDGCLKTVEAFLKWKQTINPDGIMLGTTPLTVALASNQSAVVGLLLKGGATPLSDEEMAQALLNEQECVYARLYPENTLAILRQNKAFADRECEDLSRILAQRLDLQNKCLKNNSHVNDRKEMLEKAAQEMGLEVVQDTNFLCLRMCYGDAIRRGQLSRNKEVELQREADNIEGLE